MITLRADQLQAVEELRAGLRRHQSVLLNAPCGFGKTVVAAYMAMNAHQKRRRVIFSAHRKELIRQTAKTFRRFGIPHGFIAAGMRPDPFAHVQIASAQTLMTRPHLQACDLFVPDEAHLWVSDKRVDIINTARKSGAHIVPLTATPETGQGHGLACIADYIVNGPETADLIARGHLASYRAFAPSSPDLSRIRVSSGEYVTSSVDAELGKPQVIGNRIDAYKQFASGKRMLGFAYSRQNGHDTAVEFNAAGIPAAFIDGETPDDRRRDLIAKFADREILVLVNVALAEEGFDLSAQVDRDVPIEAVGLWKPSRSGPKAVQMMMRPMRPQPEPAIILDHVNLLRDHGMPDEYREYTLEGRVKRKESSGEAAVMAFRCKACFYVQRSPFTKCPSCQAEREVEGRKVEEVDGELVELELAQMAAKRDMRMRQGMAKDLPSMARLAVEQGKRPGWVVHVMKARGTPVTYDQVVRAMRA